MNDVYKDFLRIRLHSIEANLKSLASSIESKTQDDIRELPFAYLESLYAYIQNLPQSLSLISTAISETQELIK